MATRERPGVPLYFVYNVSVYRKVQCASMMVPPHSREMYHLYLIHERKLLLQWSVCQLIKTHVFLALTDSNLVEWYNCLYSGDKQIIQDEGGLYEFLLRHPALEVMDHCVYLKCGGPPYPFMASNLCISQATGTNGRIQETQHTLQKWKMLPNKAREQESTQPGSESGSQEHLGEKICHQPVHLQDRYPTAYSSPSTETPACGVQHFSSSPLLLLNEHMHAVQMSNLSCTAEQQTDLTFEHPTANGTAACEHHSSDNIQMKATDDGGIIPPAQFKQTDTGFESETKTMMDDKSILSCLASKDLKTPDSDALLASSETEQSDQSHSKVNTAEKCTSPLPCVQTRNAAVGTEAAPCTSAFTQTEDTEQTDKHINTEVHMLDLDYLAKEFIELKTTNQKLKESKQESSGRKLIKKCECIQRAQKAELSLLAVEYSICRQHCWRLYYTSAEGDQFAMTKEPPEYIVNVLQELELDYNQMKQKILSGVPLQELKPLSVDSEKITRRASYTPALIIGDVLGYFPSGMSSELQKQNASGEESTCPDDESLNTNQVQENSRAVHTNHHDNNDDVNKSNESRAVIPEEREDDTQEHKESLAECRDDNTDTAAEDLELSGPATDDDGEVDAESSILYISNLPSNVTEDDVTLLCEKYRPSDVSISTLKNGFRVAIVMVSGAQSAEAAVRELNGHQLQGNALHLEHIGRAVCGSGLGASQDVTEIQTSNTDTSSCDQKIKTPPPLSTSIMNKMVVSDSPTAKGTFVPQHHDTMANFDMLMTELAQRHPEVGKHRIMDVLMELVVNHRGIMSSLSLRTIREMTSDILNQAAPDTK